MLGHDVLGAVVAAVHHHQGGDGQAVDLGGDGLQDVADVVGLQIGGDEDDDRAEGGVGMAATEVGPGQAHDEVARCRRDGASRGRGRA